MQMMIPLIALLIIHLNFTSSLLLNTTSPAAAANQIHNFNKSLEADALFATQWWSTDFYNHNSSDHCMWNGITCNEAASVISIDVYNRVDGLGNLGGLDFSSFPNLEHLSIYSVLSGSIPEQIGLLSNLKHLTLCGNQLTGKLPVSLTNLTFLEHHDLSQNNLEGPIPPSIGSMVNLIFLDFSTNQLNASIPQEISYLANLRILNLGDNHLDGQIPSSFSNLSVLEFLNLGMISISGPIQQLDLQKLVQLYHLDLNHNQLVGNVSIFRKPCNLLHLNLSMNLMTGAITSLHVCTGLQIIDLRSNNFVGEELRISNFPSLVFLYQSQNHLTSAIVPNTSPVNDSEIGLPCNGLSGQLTCKEHKRRNKLVSALVIFLPIIVGICFLVMCYHHHRTTPKIKIEPKLLRHGNVCSVLNYDGTIAYEDFVTATEDFDLKYCIGTGG